MIKTIAWIAALGAALISPLSTSVAKDLRVASNTTFPPFEFIHTQTNEITGFEMDLIRAMGKEAGYNVIIESMGFDGIIPALLSGAVDVGASGFSITPERKKRVLFTDPFYESGLTILIRKSSAEKIHNFNDLKGRSIAVQIGTTAAAKAKSIPDAKISTFNNASDAIMELLMGGSEAVINDKPVTAYILAQRAQIAHKTCHLPQVLSADKLAMVVSKDNPALVEELNRALATLKANGQYRAIYEKWFGKN